MRDLEQRNHFTYVMHDQDATLAGTAVKKEAISFHQQIYGRATGAPYFSFFAFGDFSKRIDNVPLHCCCHCNFRPITMPLTVHQDWNKNEQGNVVYYGAQSR